MKKTIFYFVFILFIIFCAYDFRQYASASNNKIQIFEKNGTLIFKIPNNYKIVPHIEKKLAFNREVFAKTNADLSINAGYFDTKNHETTSFVLIDGKTLLDPQTNSNLMQNPSLKEHMDKILNRSEFRVLDCGGKIEYDIAKHYDKYKNNCKIIHSIQAGPMIYPKLTLEEEYFTANDDNGTLTRDSINALKKSSRTAIGIKNNEIYIIIANTDNKKTLAELYNVCKKLHLEKALNLDGGGSTSLNYKGTANSKYYNLEIISEKNNTARKVKSFLVIK